jgi:hypothetical protein
MYDAVPSVACEAVSVTPVILASPKSRILRPPSGEHDIGGLQVAVEYAGPMRSAKAVRDLHGDAKRIVDRQAAFSLDTRFERLARVQRHGEEEVAVRGCARLEDTTQIRVIECAGRRSDLAQ